MKTAEGAEAARGDFCSPITGAPNDGGTDAPRAARLFEIKRRIEEGRFNMPITDPKVVDGVLQDAKINVGGIFADARCISPMLSEFYRPPSAPWPSMTDADPRALAELRLAVIRREDRRNWVRIVAGLIALIVGLVAWIGMLWFL